MRDFERDQHLADIDYNINGPDLEVTLEDDLSETAMLNEVFESLPARRSNVYSVRLDEELATSAKDFGRAALDTDSLSEVIRYALGRLG